MIERSRVNLAAPLAEMGHDVHIAAPYATDVYPSNAVKVHRFSVSDMAYRTIFGHMWIIHRAIQTLRPYGPFDILHAPELSPPQCWAGSKGTRRLY